MMVGVSVLWLSQEIATAYGHHLVETGKFKDGGISEWNWRSYNYVMNFVPHELCPPVFSQCGCYEEAFVAFEKANCWELVFVCSAKLQHSPAQRMAAARRIAGEGVDMLSR